MTDLFEPVQNIESEFYTAGYEDGYAHGELHGLFEGRALGQEKCFELWEEVGYYQGWAESWLERIDKPRAVTHAKTLLKLIELFPTSNPSGVATVADETVDLPTHLSHIRARYKLLCSSLGTRPRMVVGQVIDSGEGVVQGVESKKLLF